ncbi:hypothetical protein [Polyangium aurulentum]|uniref:hypothetical protein n=1 Tax=Polyangium aurulentum TaxID=2567896 RepID=UPI001F287CB0|nr:hypothetical protein [Polyangium aurulentum]
MTVLESLSASALDLLLRASTIRPAVRMRTLRRESFTDADIRELHAMANRLMSEDLEHFRVHAAANDLVHVFRRVDTGEIVGFQFWRTADIDLPRGRIILGGKLRILPEFRNHGLHLLSGLVFYLQDKLRHPGARYYRMSMASLFGFVSITEALASYKIFHPRDGGEEADALRKAFVALAAESHFRLDEETGQFFVNIFMTPETLGRYPQRYFERPAARAYAAANPDFRTNGCYLGFWFRFTPDNLGAMLGAIRRKLWRAPGTSTR